MRCWFNHSFALPEAGVWAVFGRMRSPLFESGSGRGMGRALMEKVIEIGKETDANWMTVETTSFQARPFYEKYGFKVIVELEDIPQGASTYILKKRIGD